MRILLFFIIFYPGIIICQNSVDTSDRTHYFLFSIGQGYEDGIQSFSRIPTIGIGYEYRFNKYFSFNARIYSFYSPSRDGDRFFLDSESQPLVGINFESGDEGIKTINNENSIKTLSVPLIFGIKFTPIHINDHALSIHLGWGITYNSYNWWKDYTPASIYTENGLYEDGKVSELNTFSTPVEHRHIVMGESVGISYEYNFTNSIIQLYFGENNTRFAPSNSRNFWDLSLIYKIAF